VAGSPEKIRDWQERVQSIVQNCPVRATSNPREAEALARRGVAEGFTRIVAAGGDGTINEVANGLAGSGAALGVLPLGTVNVFAMELGLPSQNLELCWEIIRERMFVSSIYRARMENISATRRRRARRTGR
jgi:diacylglycerol kinase family enzyme